jgi:hypothetical protein
VSDADLVNAAMDVLAPHADVPEEEEEDLPKSTGPPKLMRLCALLMIANTNHVVLPTHSIFKWNLLCMHRVSLFLSLSLSHSLSLSLSLSIFFTLSFEFLRVLGICTSADFHAFSVSHISA